MEIEILDNLDNKLTDVDFRNIKDLRFMIKSGSEVPTYRPRKFYEQFYIYVNGGTNRLYIYISSSSSWKYINLT